MRFPPSLVSIGITILFGFGTPTWALAQCTDEDCLGCDNDLNMGEYHHLTSESSVLDACVFEEQGESHGNEHGCGSEPHANWCLGGCFTAHGACIVEEDKLAALLEAFQIGDLERIRDAIARVGVRYAWNQSRGAYQFYSPCSDRLILHFPLRD